MHKVNDVLFDITLESGSCPRCDKSVPAGHMIGGVEFTSHPDVRLMVCEECACKEAGIEYTQYIFATPGELPSTVVIGGIL
jgi:hypothetical protein